MNPGLLCFVALVLVPSMSGQVQELNPKESIVDYLKSQTRDSSLESRAKLYAARFGNERYKGTAAQNIKLLESLLLEDENVQDALRKTKRTITKDVEKTKSKPRTGSRTVSEWTSFPRWVPCENVGVHGSYSSLVHATVNGEQVRDRDFMVTMESAASQLGNLTVSGTVQIFANGGKKPIQEFPLQSAWFKTIGKQSSISLFAKQGTLVAVPNGKRISARIEIHPILVSRTGSCSLGAGTSIVTLSE